MKKIVFATTFLFSGTALALLAVPAFAADAVVYEPAAAPVAVAYDWSGFYVGVQGGYLWGQADHSYSNGAPSDDSDPDGFIGGVHVGYNWQSGSFVYGVEGDFEGGSVDGSFENTTGITSVGTSELNWQGSIRARLGYAYDKALLYVTGGWAIGDFDFDGGPLPLPVSGGYSDTLNGWTIGAGGEWAFNEHWTARLAYRYTDFGEASGNLAPGFPGVDMPVDVTTHAVRVGVSYKF
jgi:outer membrane immunogenic protein